MVSYESLAAEADRLMHATQRAEAVGNWSLYERLSAEWKRVEELLIEMEVNGG